MAIRVLSISIEKKLFEDGPIRRRILEQLDEVEKAVILVFAKNKFDQAIGNTRIISTNSKSRWFYVWDAIRIARRMRQEKFDVVTTYDPAESALAGWFASKYFKCALAIQDHGYHFHRDYYARESFSNRLRSIFAHWAIKRADAIRAVSKKTELALLRLGVRQDKIMRFPVALMNTHSVPVGLNLEDKKPYFLLVARFTKIKRIDLAIQAFKIFSANQPEYKLLIIGSGQLVAEIKSLIADFKLEDRVELIPWADSLTDYYRNATATLITSDREGFGMTALESLINKTPVIMTDVGCAEEIIMPGKNGLIVPIDNALKFAEAMESLVQNQEAFKQGAQEFVWNASQFKMMDFLQTAIQNHKKLRLLFVTQSVDKNDPILAFTAGWIQEFLDAGCEMAVFTRHMVVADLPRGAVGQDLGKSVIMRVLKLWYYSFRLRKQYDAVLVHMTPQLMVLGAPIWILLGKRKYMWYMHRSVTWWLKVALWFNKKTFTASDLSLRLPHPKKTIVGHGIDTEQFKVLDVKREPQLLWISRIHPRKHLEDTLEFMSEFKHKHPDVNWKLKVIGTAEGHEDYLELMKKKAIELGVDGHLIFTGAIKREDLPEIYARATAFISTSQTGSLDKVVLEALACGTPVFAQGEEYFGLPGVTSLIDHEAALVKLAGLLSNPITDERARQGIVQEHDLKRLINKLIDEMSA
ncbi:MAG: glycosyltransferase [Patescibacteria group bacterium]